jgi:hypothetical protein
LKRQCKIYTERFWEAVEKIFATFEEDPKSLRYVEKMLAPVRATADLASSCSESG